MGENNRTDEVNKIVRNHLSRELTICLPSVGSLSVCRIEAHLVSPKRLKPPFKRVVFSSKQDGDSLIDIIIAMTGCDESSAHEIYSRWLDQVRNGSEIEIDGVGKLCNGEFYADTEFDKLLNPCSRDVVQLSSRSSALKIVALLLLLAAVGGGAYIGFQYANPKVVIDAPAPISPVEVIAEADVVVADTLNTAEVVIPVEVDVQVVGKMNANRNYVVLGVFTTEVNALRAVEDVRLKESSLKCRIYNYGAKFMVAMFESDESTDCDDFIRDHRDSFGDLWIYRAK